MIALLVPLSSVKWPPAQRSAGAVKVPSTSALPVALPPLGTSSRLVFAHYLPSLPLSLDNKSAGYDYYARQYLSPWGERGKHRAYGGFLRDRPLPRDPMPDADWRLLDMESEVRQGIAAGIDGFSVDILQVGRGPLWRNARLLLDAARKVDSRFKIMLMPDMSGSLQSKTPATLARYVAQLGRYTSAYRLGDGRLVVSPFLAEKHSAQWWATFLDIMSTTYATPVAFWPVFLDEQTHAQSFAAISYGMSNWGSRNPAHNNPTTTHSTSPRGRIAKVRALGQKWMQPVSVQDARPRSGIYDEAENTTNLRNTWQIATDARAEVVHLVTWNDYSEGTQFAPSVRHGSSFLDMSAYYLVRYKSGLAPTVLRDTAYVTHRTQRVSAKPRFPQTLLMHLRGGSRPRNTIEVLTLLTAPAQVRLTVGSKAYQCAASSGPDTCLFPLSTGRPVRAEILRNGVATATVSSPYSIFASPYVQDLQYVAVSGSRPTLGGR